MSRRKDLFSKVRVGMRLGMNKVQDAIGDFESKGGIRGAAERTRVRAESAARRLQEELKERGVDLGSWVPMTPDQEAEIRQHHRTLDVEFGADFDTIKTAYRKKMREHHPDRHTGNPEAEKEATRKSQDITIAYEAIEIYYRSGRHNRGNQ